MSIFSSQKVYCQVCGKEFEVTLANAPWDGRVCSDACWQELAWRAALSITGKSYYGKPGAKHD